MPASPEAWRCFVAVPAPPDLRLALEDAVAGWRREAGAPDLRWADPAGWHLTLAFLGQTDAAQIPALAATLDEVVAAAVPFTISTGRLGAFPRPGAALSAWLGIEDLDGHLRDLAAAVQAAVLDPDRRRPLRAHLTLGRSRARRGEPLAGWLESRSFPAMPIGVSEVVLYRSHLGRGPARYERLAAAALGGAGSAHG
jgi:2'-5' RNA ligase